MHTEIGGYFSLECGHKSQYHKDVVMLNSGRNALRYVIRAYNINEMYVPIYTCPVIWEAISSEDCKIIPYDIDANFMPIGNIPDNAFVLYNNYFGVCGKNVDKLAKKYTNLIVDNAQAFYVKNKGIASIYSPRKFFGVPDGGLVICKKRLNDIFDTDISYDSCMHLLKRVDLGANAGYSDFLKNENALMERYIKQISLLTKAIMGNIDYDFARRQRIKNFKELHTVLAKYNGIQIDMAKDDVPMVYPFRTENVRLYKHLIDNNVFVAKYWSMETDGCMDSVRAQCMANTIIPLPIDQRYDQKDMKKILKIMEEYK